MIQPPDFSDEEKDYIDELYERYPEPYPEYRRQWYIEKMMPDRITVDFIEQFLIWNSQYIPSREAIIREWPRKIKKGQVLVLCDKAAEEHPDSLMCTGKTLFRWLKKNHYLFDQRKYWLNDCSKHAE